MPMCLDLGLHVVAVRDEVKAGHVSRQKCLFFGAGLKKSVRRAVGCSRGNAHVATPGVHANTREIHVSQAAAVDQRSTENHLGRHAWLWSNLLEIQQ